jgi:hypothetical protein
VISAKIASALLVISMLIVDLDSLLKIMYSFYILSVVKVAVPRYMKKGLSLLSN